MIIVERGGAEYESLNAAFQAAAPMLGLLLAQAALRAVDEGELALVAEDGHQVIMTWEEAGDPRGVAGGLEGRSGDHAGAAGDTAGGSGPDVAAIADRGGNTEGGDAGLEAD